MSGVTQGSVLGPILFLVYINDLEEGVTGKILKFADETKLFTKTKDIGDKKNVQDDIDKLVNWSKMADVIQFWEMQMSTRRTWKYKYDQSNWRDYSKYDRKRKRPSSNNEF